MEVRKIVDPRHRSFGYQGEPVAILTTKAGTIVRWWTGMTVIQALYEATEIVTPEGCTPA